MGTGCSSNRHQEIKKTTEVPGLKIAVIGDSEVGKSCILDRYINNLYSPLYIQTTKIALRNVVRKLNIPGHATVPITFWDIPGQEDLDIHESYFRNLDAVIVVVDASSPSSIENGKLWRLSVLSNATFTNDENNGKIVEKKPENIESNEDPSTTTNNDVAKKCMREIPFLLLGNKEDLIPREPINNPEIVQKEKEEVATETRFGEGLISTNQMIEQASLGGFVGGVLVSAKSNDLSVHGAIQSFLRHILEKQYVDRRWKPVDKAPKTKRERYKFTPQLETVGINEIDEEFSKADEIMHRVKSLHSYQDDSLAKFATQCVETDVIDSAKNASMQNCLVALRNKLDSLDLKLKLVLMDDFYTLEVKADVADAELESSIRYAIKTFNKEFVAVTMTMLKEYPLAEEKIEKIEKTVDNLCLQYKVPPATENNQVMTSTDLYRKSVIIEKNRAKMRHTVHECQDCLTSIQASVKQVKTAFVW